MDIVDPDGQVHGQVPAPIAVVSDNGPCFRGEVFAEAFTGDDPLLRHVRTRVKSPQTNGVVERFFGSLKYEHLYRGHIGDGDARRRNPAVPPHLQHHPTPPCPRGPNPTRRLPHWLLNARTCRCADASSYDRFGLLVRHPSQGAEAPITTVDEYDSLRVMLAFSFGEKSCGPSGNEIRGLPLAVADVFNERDGHRVGHRFVAVGQCSVNEPEETLHYRTSAAESPRMSRMRARAHIRLSAAEDGGLRKPMPSPSQSLLLHIEEDSETGDQVDLGVRIATLTGDPLSPGSGHDAELTFWSDSDKGRRTRRSARGAAALTSVSAADSENAELPTSVRPRTWHRSVSSSVARSGYRVSYG
jgi:hypothetical protein